jgi:beta-carotene 15,15'-monooxygenase
VYDGATALPTVSPAVEGRHRYVYAQHAAQPVTEWPREVVRFDAETGATTTFAPDGDVALSEPVVAPRPDGAAGEGVVLTVGLDHDAGRSVLFVLDAEMTERARVRLPHAVPYDFHGRWFPELDRGTVDLRGAWP